MENLFTEQKQDNIVTSEVTITHTEDEGISFSIPSKTSEAWRQTAGDPVNPNYYSMDDGSDFNKIQESICRCLPGDEAMYVVNILKYVKRYKQKNGIEDIDKMLWYGNNLRRNLAEKLNKEDNK